MAYPRRPIAKTNGTLAVTTGSVVAVADNPARLYLRITNPDAAAIMYVKFATAGATTLGGAVPAPTATADTASLKIPPGGFFETTAYTGPVAIIGSAGFNANVLEI
jgi:hypothetical protein